MGTRSHASYVIKGIISDLRRTYGAGWELLHRRQRSAEVHAAILSITLGQDESVQAAHAFRWARELCDAYREMEEKS
ncbi:hypothetical protein UFOVP141_28 [uncultured Caudovirales phage]|uniref:Uncharacterized protein n=1 Tax=uncultured Caudovirales phage TaxID=2100421 RepID=A0A6J7VQQ7_9CAUD|nr:hypothetical protein UFOVP141_28 [uncultured Caudovirales phage]